MSEDVNKSGLQPVEYKVLVKPDDAPARHGVIIVPDTARGQMKSAQIKGTLVAKGGRAFEDWGNPQPGVGDRVYFAKYSGLEVKGVDGDEYRLVRDEDICGIVYEEAQQNAVELQDSRKPLGMEE